MAQERGHRDSRAGATSRRGIGLARRPGVLEDPVQEPLHPAQLFGGQLQEVVAESRRRPPRSGRSWRKVFTETRGLRISWAISAASSPRAGHVAGAASRPGSKA